MECSRHHSGTTCEGAGHEGPWFEVRCEDGEVRHDRPFGDKAAAKEFAEWGHACTSSHTITPIDEDGLNLMGFRAEKVEGKA